MATVAAPELSVLASPTTSVVTGSASAHSAVRIEGESNSIGRSYSCSAKGANIVRGLGAQRRALRSKTWDPYAGGKVTPTLESLTLANTHLATASRADFLDYFRNTWALTDVLFSALRDDSVFYMVPDKLRRP